ncbi:MAG: hypothetical protein EBR34_08720 [Sphingomonadaceae bacterium]|nr:hypothetical protein [Sphingomonadaceae bacterium]
MNLPEPVPGLVIRYAYLWSHEAATGLEEGGKDRPAAILLTTRARSGDTVVLALPVTHAPPADPALAVEIPVAIKRKLGLDAERSWIILTELNRFVWPGPDLRPISDTSTRYTFGLLPEALYETVRSKWLEAYDRGQVSEVVRTV